MIGKLILVSGLSGAGKTTLIKAALNHIPNLHYLQTVTTRPQRDGESGSIEYTFVSDKEYEIMKSQSANWDHTEYTGHKYGADVDKVKSLLSTGNKVVCSVTPDLEVIKDMAKLYGIEPITIWIDTSYEVAKARVNDDEARSQRVETENIKNAFACIFKPSGDLQKDKADFTELLKRF